MTIQNLSIVLDNPDLLYYPGQPVKGRVMFLLDLPQIVRGIKIKINGKAVVKWEDTQISPRVESHLREISHVGKEEYFSYDYNLLDCVDQMELTVGEHVYLFDYVLPLRLPSSFEDEYGHVRYKIKTKLNLLSSENKSAKIYFQIDDPLNLNLYPELKEPYKETVEKSFGCCFCCRGLLTMILSVPYTGYSAGQSISLMLEVDNVTNININCIKCYLLQKIKWLVPVPKNEFKYTEHILTDMELMGVPRRSSRTFHEYLPIPTKPVPNLVNCNIINIAHTLKIEISLNNSNPNVSTEILIQLGGLPLMINNEIGFPTMAICPPCPINCSRQNEVVNSNLLFQDDQQKQVMSVLSHQQHYPYVPPTSPVIPIHSHSPPSVNTAQSSFTDWRNQSFSE